ncbi:putative efflux pump outer membrane protein SepC [Alteripontixanthobacter maritimus]|uniref:Putative efflux pump outer membrane protein SepC n=1 Tax=Alteripontixanthobacter maritimus TaxID=2161824 RepID=A0A369QCK4_9SPHN|nr:efflux transporter outer membrane subunit [Alteripontixanthobacter maritimus]RDC61295.1 putative efflux pump outer membrane protein SepC [Alteripontixanthobacter maritimus]
MLGRITGTSIQQAPRRFRVTGTLALASSLSVLSACTAPLALEAPRPAVSVPAAWQQADPAPLTIDLVDYWRLLDDPLIDRFVAQSITANRELAAAAARVAQSRSAVRQARASYLPQVDASGGVRRDFGDFASDELNFSLGGDVSWEADIFGRVDYAVAASEAELAGSGFALADLQRLIVGQVAQTTISARASAIRLAIARDTLAIQDENLQIARWRREAGLVSSLDVEQARSQRAQTAATIPAIESDLASSANAISTLIGEAPGPVLALLEDAATIPLPPAGFGFDAPAEILRRRPDVRRAETALLADTARLGLARTQLLPLVQLTGNIGAAFTNPSNLFDIITGGLFAGVRQLVFDGGRTRAQIDGAEAAAGASLAGWEQSILGALEDVESAAVALRAARERVVIFNEALDAGRNAALLARSQYQAGLIDFQTLLTAENQLLGARNALVASEADRAAAFVRLTQALGGGWTPADLQRADLQDAGVPDADLSDAPLIADDVTPMGERIEE